MKRIVLPGVLILTFMVLSCEKKAEIRDDVELYVQQLIKGEYDRAELPAFSPEQIPALLKFRNDTTQISNFPHNPISSLWIDECRLGIYVLWTIESIRAVEIQSKYLIGRFPSQNPYIYFSNPDLMIPYNLNDAHTTAANSYFNWWLSDLTISEKLVTDPMKNTGYAWH